jgi:hypothetical protein
MPFGMWNKKVQVTVDRQKQVDLGYAIRLLEQGDTSPMARIEHDVVFNDISFLEPRLAKRTVANAIRERIARGLYFYVPEPQSPELIEELDEVDRGTMTINADGIAFAGKTRRIAVGFGAVESIGHTREGITVLAKNSHRLYFGVLGRNNTVTFKVQDRVYEEPLSGTLLRLLVEALMKVSLEGRN